MRFAVAEVDFAAAAVEIRAIRERVFIVEQHVPRDLEWDGLDPTCAHVLARDETGGPIGTGRLTPDGHIGRMAVLAPWRGRGVGAGMLKLLMDMARRRGATQVALHAQTHAIPFYARYGFTPQGEVFEEAGIPHRKMVANTTHEEETCTRT